MSDLLSASQVAEKLGLCKTTVLRYYRAGRIPGVKINGRVIRFDLESVKRSLVETSGVTPLDTEYQSPSLRALDTGDQ